MFHFLKKEHASYKKKKSTLSRASSQTAPCVAFGSQIRFDAIVLNGPASMVADSDATKSTQIFPPFSSNNSADGHNTAAPEKWNNLPAAACTTMGQALLQHCSREFPTTWKSPLRTPSHTVYACYGGVPLLIVVVMTGASGQSKSALVGEVLQPPYYATKREVTVVHYAALIDPSVHIY